MRFVNIMVLSSFGIGGIDFKIKYDEFYDFFTEDKPVIINFHGYPRYEKDSIKNQNEMIKRDFEF